MKPRDAIIVAAVVLIAGFAAADAIRGRAESRSSSSSTEGVQTTPTRLPGPTPQAEAPPGWPVGGLPGTLVFTNAEDCRVRVVGLPGGVERPVARFEGNCQLWVPPITDRFAYGLGPTSGDGFSPFRIGDLARPQRELGGFRALFGVVVWSQDGQRIAWCGRRRTGFDLQVDGPARRLPRCPIAYTRDGRIAWTIGNRLYVEGRVVLRADGGITFAAFPIAPRAASVVVVVDGRRVEGWNGQNRTELLDLPENLQGRTPILSPDGCIAAFRPQEDFGEIEVRDLGCNPNRRPRTFPGRDAAWSPDGRWLAVADRGVIVFHRMDGSSETIRWPADAARLAWRER